MRRMLVMIALAALLLFGCGSATHNLQKGIDSYERTDYRGAMSQWSHLTTSEKSLAQRSLVRYLVYRGLTHYRLGDRSSALSYLARGKDALVRGSASWVRAEIVAEMDKALADLNGAPGEPTEPSPAATPPDPPTTGEALVPIKRPPVESPSGKTDVASGSPGPDKTDVTRGDPAPAKTAAASTRPAPAKTAAASAGPAPTKVSSPSTKTSPAVQSTSPK